MLHARPRFLAIDRFFPSTAVIGIPERQTHGLPTVISIATLEEQTPYADVSQSQQNLQDHCYQ